MSANVTGKYLDRKDSDTYYGKELPYHFQDDMTKDILRTSAMRPEDALAYANEEQKSIKASTNQEKENDGDYMHQIKNLDRGRRIVDQSERSAKLYERYIARNSKRLTPDRANIMIESVSSKRKNFGGKNKTKRNKKRKTRKIRHRKRHHKKR
jgi:hypothetical protein